MCIRFSTERYAIALATPTEYRFIRPLAKKFYGIVSYLPIFEGRITSLFMQSSEVRNYKALQLND
ncbi:MAG: hypothetical protein KME28_19825, partial [Pelatocladus maniniholoensis HA4357-MV3]|nr:hypothetical protein [Pelatocladus maniniholoensis HA4357-MV3]